MGSGDVTNFPRPRRTRLRPVRCGKVAGTLSKAWMLTLLALSGCANQDPEGAATLWARIGDHGYRAMARAPGYEARRASDAIHADEVDVYVNPVITDAIAARAPLAAWPEGSLIVKDGWDGDELRIIAVMEKRDARWYFAEYHGDGSVAASGAPAVCVGCHRSGEDSVRAFGLPR